jgi:hypothetical protein
VLELPKIRGCMCGRCVHIVLTGKTADSITLLLWEGCLVGYGFWSSDISQLLSGCFKSSEKSKMARSGRREMKGFVQKENWLREIRCLPSGQW